MEMTMLQKVVLPNGEEMTYRYRDGGDQVVLLIHGNMTSSFHWDVLMDALDTSYTIYAPDLRGFGGSSYQSRVTGIKDFSDDVKGFVDALGLRGFHMVGWSTGGAVCMQFVADNPGYCEKLVLLASASTRGYPFYGTNPDGTPNMERRLVVIEEVEQDTGKTKAVQGLYDTRNKAGLQALWNALIYTHTQPAPDKYDAYVEDMLTQRNLADVYYSLNTFNISPYANDAAEGTDQAKDITIPVLVLRGDRDYVVTEQMTNEILEDLGENAKFVSLNNCGHSPLIDDIEQLKKEIEAFFE